MCVHCGWCEVVAPNCIVIVDDIPYVIPGFYDYYPEWFYAIVECPVGAISYTNY